MNANKLTTDELLLQRAKLQREVSTLDGLSHMRTVEQSERLREARRELAQTKTALKSRFHQERIPF